MHSVQRVRGDENPHGPLSGREDVHGATFVRLLANHGKSCLGCHRRYAGPCIAQEGDCGQASAAHPGLVLTQALRLFVSLLLLLAVAHAAEATDTWRAIGPPDSDVRAIAIDPATPGTLYIGTFDDGAFKSTDGGDTWSALELGIGAGAPVMALAIDPVTPATVYAGVFFDGVFKSVDAGATWRSVGGDPGYFYTLAVDPSMPDTIYAATYNGLFKSADGGETWRTLGFSGGDAFSLAIDPAAPSRLYAGVMACPVIIGSCRQGCPCTGDVMVSGDGGATWEATGMGGLVSALVLDPITPTTLYAGTADQGVFKSKDAGNSWRALDKGLTSTDVRALAIDPLEPRRIYAGTAAGVFASGNGGKAWSALDDGLTNTDILALAVDPVEPRRLYAGTYGAGVFVIEQTPAGGDGDGGCAIAPAAGIGAPWWFLAGALALAIARKSQEEERT